MTDHTRRATATTMVTMPIGGSGGFWIRAHEVRKAGAAAREAAEDIPADAKTLYAPTDTAVAGLPGWRTAAALDTCTEEWTKALRALAALVAGAGDAVTASAGDLAGEDADRGRHFDGMALQAPYGAAGDRRP
ncbi:hypothetical protein [Streptomyces paludis]|uniref:hypothetical protein n=1 Tax=Streptomyces paludis TaxID=2282738 RepID=UPI0013B37C77|nr:hypothetical protein [Streptomyces paludis]